MAVNGYVLACGGDPEDFSQGWQACRLMAAGLYGDSCRQALSRGERTGPSHRPLTPSPVHRAAAGGQSAMSGAATSSRMVRLACVFNMRVQVVPHQNDGAAELLVRGIQQAGVVSVGKALTAALGGTTVEVDAVDQPGPVAGLAQAKRSRSRRAAHAEPLTPSPFLRGQPPIGMPHPSGITRPTKARHDPT